MWSAGCFAPAQPSWTSVDRRRIPLETVTLRARTPTRYAGWRREQGAETGVGPRGCVTAAPLDAAREPTRARLATVQRRLLRWTLLPHVPTTSSGRLGRGAAAGRASRPGRIRSAAESASRLVIIGVAIYFSVRTLSTLRVVVFHDRGVVHRGGLRPLVRRLYESASDAGGCGHGVRRLSCLRGGHAVGGRRAAWLRLLPTRGQCRGGVGRSTTGSSTGRSASTGDARRLRRAC